MAFDMAQRRSIDGNPTPNDYPTHISTRSRDNCTFCDCHTPKIPQITTKIATHLDPEAMNRLLTLMALAAFVPCISCDTSGSREKAGLERRIDRFCSRVPSTTHLEQLCEKSCGTGYTQCTNYYTCFNPGLGQVCCPDGRKLTQNDDKVYLQAKLTLWTRLL